MVLRTAHVIVCYVKQIKIDDRVSARRCIIDNARNGLSDEYHHLIGGKQMSMTAGLDVAPGTGSNEMMRPLRLTALIGILQGAAFVPAICREFREETTVTEKALMIHLPGQKLS
jgi:hypothetical protein